MQVHPGEPIREWVHNSQTRWQSDEAMAARALAEQAALIRMMNNIEELWQQQGAKMREKPPVLSCRLTPMDWRIIEAIQRVLSPFKIASLQLQGNGDVGDRETCGRFDEYFPVIEDLLDHLENCVNGEYIEERKDPMPGEDTHIVHDLFKDLDRCSRHLLKVFIRLGWWKLHIYYNKMESLAYAAAVILHPCLKVDSLESLWASIPCRQRDGWKSNYLERLRKCWRESYKKR